MQLDSKPHRLSSAVFQNICGILSSLILTTTALAFDSPRYDQTRLPVIDGIIGNQPARCLISTTTPVTAVDVRLMNSPKLKREVQVVLEDADKMNDMIRVKGVKVSSGDVTITMDSVGVTDLSNHRTLVGQDFDAIIGNDFLKYVVLNFDPEKVWISSRFELQDQDYASLPLKYENGLPTVQLELKGLGSRSFAIRTTSSFELHLAEPTADRLVEVERASRGGNTFSQKIDGLFPATQVICAEIAIGPCKFQNVPAYISESNALGMSILKRMRFSIDPARNVVLVGSKTHGRANWFPRNDSRFHLLFLTSSKLIVDRVISDIPAHGTDLQQNDEILLIEGSKPAELSLNDVLRYLSQSETPVPIVYSRNGKQHETMLSIPKTYEYPPKWEKSPEEKAREFFERME